MPLNGSRKSPPVLGEGPRWRVRNEACSTLCAVTCGDRQARLSSHVHSPSPEQCLASHLPTAAGDRCQGLPTVSVRAPQQIKREAYWRPMPPVRPRVLHRRCRLRLPPPAAGIGRRSARLALPQGHSRWPRFPRLCRSTARRAVGGLAGDDVARRLDLPAPARLHHARHRRAQLAQSAASQRRRRRRRSRIGNAPTGTRLLAAIDRPRRTGMMPAPTGLAPPARRSLISGVLGVDDAAAHPGHPAAR